MIELPIVLTVDQLAEFLGRDRSELCRAIRAGRVPGAYRAGKRLFIGRDTFLKSFTRAAATAPKVGDPLNGTGHCVDMFDFDLLGDI